MTEINSSDFEITSGYVGSMGKIYKAASDKTLSEAIVVAATYNDRTEEEIRKLLLDGMAVEWCKSPNYYYDHSKGIIRRKRVAKPPSTRKMSGQLWQPCARRSCEGEPVCVDCEYCERHCDCEVD